MCRAYIASSLSGRSRIADCGPKVHRGARTVTPEEFRAFGHRVVDLIADYRRDVAQYPVMARTAPGEIKAALPAEPPTQPEPFDHILRDLDRVIMPGLTH